MKKNVWLLPAALFFFSACSSPAAPVTVKETVQESAPQSATLPETGFDEALFSAYPAGVLCDAIPEGDDLKAALKEKNYVRFFALDENRHQTGEDTFVSFENYREAVLLPGAEPVPFREGKAVFMTYDRNGDSRDCVDGRNLVLPEEWGFLEQRVFSLPYAADENAAYVIGSPAFILREKQNGEWTETERYCLNFDGTVCRFTADGGRFRSETALSETERAYLFLLYETYFQTAPSLSLLRGGVLLKDARVWVKKDGKPYEITSPEKKAAFAEALSDREEDPEGFYRFDVRSVLRPGSDYPSKEVLRFIVIPSESLPAESNFWFVLCEDGHLYLEAIGSAGWIDTVGFWGVYLHNRLISESAFSVEKALEAFSGAEEVFS